MELQRAFTSLAPRVGKMTNMLTRLMPNLGGPNDLVYKMYAGAVLYHVRRPSVGG